MKNYLDERQYQISNSIAANAFYAMFAVSVISIIVQLILLDTGVMNVIGQTIILLGGGIVYLVCCVKKGIFSLKGKSLTWLENLLISVMCSGIFTIFYGIVISKNTMIKISKKIWNWDNI
ncbi:MAG: DUF6773 family protein [Lachnotalea sp.]